MKTTAPRSSRPLLAVAAVTFLGAVSAYAQADSTFTGGSGAPLGLTIDAPVAYLVTSVPNESGPIFVFQGAGNVFGGTGEGVPTPPTTGNLTYTGYGTTPQTITGEGSGASIGALSLNDFYVGAPFITLTVGEVVILDTGSITTTTDVAGQAPASGPYTTFLVDGDGDRISTNGIALVPEPSTWATMLLSGVGLLYLASRRRRRLA